MTNEGSLLSVRRIYYRGKLNSCNYTCSYCPFGKKSHPTSKMQDKQAWSRFTAIEQWEGDFATILSFPMVKHSYIAIIGKESYSLRHCRKLPEFPVRLIFLFLPMNG